MIKIYTDGSCIGNQNVDNETPAGWGVVVITGSNDLGRGNGEIMHEFNGKVITDFEDEKFSYLHPFIFKHMLLSGNPSWLR